MDVHQGRHEHKQTTSSRCTLPVGFFICQPSVSPGETPLLPFTPAAFISPVFPVCFKFHGLLALLQSNLQTGLLNLWDFAVINKVAFCLERFEKEYPGNPTFPLIFILQKKRKKEKKTLKKKPYLEWPQKEISLHLLHWKSALKFCFLVRKWFPVGEEEQDWSENLLLTSATHYVKDRRKKTT